MAKKTQIAVGARGGRIAGYSMQDGKLKPIYVGTEQSAPGGKSKVPKKKDIAIEKPPVFKEPTDIGELEVDLASRLKGKDVMIAHDYRTGSDGTAQKVLRFTGPGGSITGYLSKFNSLVLFPPDRDYLQVGSPSDKNLDAVSRFVLKYTRSALDLPSHDEVAPGAELTPTIDSASRILGAYTSKKAGGDRRKKSLSDKVPREALEEARNHFRGGGDRKSLLPKMTEHFGGDAKKARRFIRKVHATVVSKSELKKGMSGRPDAWAATILEAL